MARILLGVTGSVAAIKLPEIDAALLAAGHDVKLVATKASTYFFDPSSFRDRLSLDEDEWPGPQYRRGDEVLHIELRKWADLFLIAPLDANSLAKLSLGLCDNLLTSIWRAWDLSRPIIVAPAMNTLMWQHPLTKQHLRALGMMFGALHVPGHLTEEQMVDQINERSRNLWIAPPASKVLACGDEGVGAMAAVPDVIAGVERLLSQRG
jgi:phosphopantothenoylcysteine decarboxylase